MSDFGRTCKERDSLHSDDGSQEKLDIRRVSVTLRTLECGERVEEGFMSSLCCTGEAG
jgi:hypothetical protein